MNITLVENLYQEELYHIPTNVMVIIPKPWHKILEDEKALVTKILGSVKLNIDSVCIVFKPNVSIADLNLIKPGKVLIFGSSTTEEVKPYEKVLIDGIAVIKADDLSELDDVKKKTLWLALKQMFAV